MSGPLHVATNPGAPISRNRKRETGNQKTAGSPARTNVKAAVQSARTEVKAAG